MTISTLRGDCAQCAALCCVALAFDRSPLFAFDKPAGEPCANLSARGRCAIHAERTARGFAGCEAYDCLGAGQAVTQDLFGGMSWRDDPALLRPMMEAFVVMRSVQETRQLLGQAAELALPRATKAVLRDHARRLAPQTGWTWPDVASHRIERAVEEARAVLRSLAPRLVTDGGKRPRALSAFDRRANSAAPPRRSHCR
jgi:hypothetical protein